MTSRRGRPRSVAAATSAAASGCSLAFSTLATSPRIPSASPSRAHAWSSRGFPTVRVPVLSTRSVSTSRSTCRASASRKRTPILAPRPMPTMMESGVASPSAHGQATISTAVAVASAWTKRGSGPKTSHAANVTAARSDHGRHEPGGDAVHELLERRTAALRLPDPRHDAGEQRVGADGVRAHHDAPGAVEGPAGHAVARALLGGDGLAREHRLVDRGRALEDDAVDRDALPRPHAEPVARDHVPERDVLLGPVVVETSGRARREGEERAQRVARLAAGGAFEDLSEQDERDDDRGGLEVDGAEAHAVAVGGRDDLREEGHRPCCSRTRPARRGRPA